MREESTYSKSGFIDRSTKKEPLRLFRFALLVGVVSIVLAIFIVAASYYFALKSAQQEFDRYYMGKAKMLVAAASHEYDLTDTELLFQIQNLWSSGENRPEDEYICITDAKGNLLLHSAFPETVGNFAGSNALLGPATTACANLQELIDSKNDYVGIYISSAGQKQLAAFAYLPAKGWAIGVHRSKAALDSQVWGYTFPFMAGLLSIILILLPASLTLHYQAFKGTLAKAINAESSAIESEERYGYLVDAMGEGIVIINAGKVSKFSFANPAAERLFGVGSGELVGRQLTEFCDPDGIQEVEDQLEVRRSGKESTYRMTLIRPDGSKRFIQVTASPRFDSENNFLGSFSLLIDITERHRAEKALKESEANLNKAQSTASIGHWSLNPDTLVVKGSAELMRIFGLDIDQTLTLDDFSQVVHPDDLDYNLDHIHLGLSHGKSWDIEHRLLLADGTVKTVHAIGETTTDSSGKTIALEGIVQDITARKIAEEALNTSNTILEESQRIGKLGSYLFYTEEGRWISSDVMDEIFGIPSDYLRDTKGWFDLIHPDDKGQMQEYLAKHVISQRQPFNKEYRIVRFNDGDERWVHGRGELKFSETGDLIQMIGTIQDITEGKLAEETLRASEERFSAFMTNAPVYAYIKDQNLTHLYMNQQTKELILDSTSEDTRTIDIFEPEVAELLEASDKKILQGNTPSEEMEYRAIVKGEERWFRDFKFPIPLADKSLILGGVALDITESKKAEEQLKVKKSILESIAFVQREFLIEPDSRKSFDRMLEILLEVTGSEYGFIGEILHEADGIPYLKTQAVTNIAWTDELRAYYNDNAPIGMEFKNLETLFGEVMKTGNTVIANNAPDDPRRGGIPAGHPPLNSFLGLPFYHGNEAIGMVGLANRPGGYDEEILKTINPIQVTCASLVNAYRLNIERNRAEEQLNRLNTAIQQAEEIVVITDTEGTIQYVNPAFSRVTGYSEEEAIGRNIKMLSSGQQDAAFYEDLWKTIGCGKPWRGRFLNKKKDGSLYHEDSTISPILDANDQITNYVTVKRDRTQEFSLEEQLRQTQKMEAIGTLAGGIAHDFNNILFAILGNADLAAEEISRDHPASESLDQIKIAGKRAAELVKQILTFSRRADKQTRVISVSSILKETVRMLRASLPTTIGISLRLNTATTTINADPTEIHQVIMNLCTNAGHAMLANGGELEIELASIEVDALVQEQNLDLSEGSYLVIRVSDTGPGISPELLDKIFEPFFTTKEIGEGTGMGLAVVHGIILDLNGAVNVVSEVGKGTSFQLYIPLVNTDVSIGGSTAHEISRGTERVLVVDDEPAIANMVASILEGLGYTITVFTNSQEALQAYKEAPGDFDLIITDQTMDKLTGGDLAKEILAIDPQQSIILCTGFSHTMPREKAQEIGITAYINKPISKENLAETVRQVLDRNS